MQGLNQQDATDVILKKARLYLKTLKTETCLHRSFLNQQNSDFVFQSVYSLPQENFNFVQTNLLILRFSKVLYLQLINGTAGEKKKAMMVEFIIFGHRCLW